MLGATLTKPSRYFGEGIKMSKPSMIQADVYPQCCGAKILSGMDMNTPEKFAQELEQAERIARSQQAAIATFILNDRQLKKAGIIPEKLGWKRCTDLVPNPVHDGTSSVIMYAKEVTYH